MPLSKDRVGRFTASRIGDLIVGPRGGTATRDKYIKQKAVEKYTGIVNRSIKTYAIEHGEYNEYEALEAFRKVYGKVTRGAGQIFYAFNEDSGSTPDDIEIDFDDKPLATIDAKCPQPDGFFEQKMMFINQSKPEYQNVPQSYYYQAQLQMMSVGVDKHYLVRYLAEYFEDDMGEMVQLELPLEERIFCTEIYRDEKVCAELEELIKQAALERDKMIEIFKTPIINKIINETA